MFLVLLVLFYYLIVFLKEKWLGVNSKGYLNTVIELSFISIMYFILFYNSQIILVSQYVSTWSLRLFALSTFMALLSLICFINDMNNLSKSYNFSLYIATVVTISYGLLLFFPDCLLIRLLNIYTGVHLVVITVIFLRITLSVFKRTLENAKSKKILELKFSATMFALSLLFMLLSILFLAINRFLGIIYGPIAILSSIFFAISLISLVFALNPPEILLKIIRRYSLS